ncbi:hypothetical protein [Allonocardiopsis opalescens]|uniref:Uncharacterized protein n=1 Tax=Allonocardiopsis opalescens TaxID=1144618 RepID=A0A2T0PVH5_9ACTN|nr:hypothetical protein [Allonocardiopsis opalescens]PRX95532.1 hypothetical protein CLV72_109141 [Allonocardiopsis opalescens]
MPTYRVQLTDGTQRTVDALRVRADSRSLLLENRTAGVWSPVLCLGLDQVSRVQRRLNESDGSWTWLTESVPSAVTGIKSWA